MHISENQKKKYNMALDSFMLNNNKRCGIQVGGSILFSNKVIKIIQNEELIDTFISDVSIQDNVGPGLFCLVIENQELIQNHAGKMFF